MDVHLGVEVFQIAFNNLNASNGETIEKSWKCHHPPSFPVLPAFLSPMRLLSLDFRRRRGECRARALLAILSSPTTLFRSVPRRIPGWILRGMKKSVNSSVLALVFATFKAAPIFVQLYLAWFTYVLYLVNLHCAFSFCARSPSHSIIRRWRHCCTRPLVSLHRADRIFAHFAIYAALAFARFRFLCIFGLSSRLDTKR